MTFGEKLSTLRRENNYTQEQLAEQLGVSRQSVSKWEQDIAYPETDKLIKIGTLFNCSMDYLLKDNVTDKSAQDGIANSALWTRLPKERKSEKQIFGMPLYHIGKNAHGFFAIGLRAKGVFALGLLASGIVSLGLLSIGILSFGLLALGLIAFGTLSIGVLSIGSIAFGILSLGAISIGVFSIGALSVGMLSGGALAIGKYIAIGDNASAMIAFGISEAEGSLYHYVGDIWNLPKVESEAALSLLEERIPSVLNWAKELFKAFFL